MIVQAEMRPFAIEQNNQSDFCGGMLWNHSPSFADEEVCFKTKPFREGDMVIVSNSPQLGTGRILKCYRLYNRFMLIIVFGRAWVAVEQNTCRHYNSEQ